MQTIQRILTILKVYFTTRPAELKYIYSRIARIAQEMEIMIDMQAVQEKNNANECQSSQKPFNGS